MVLVHDYFPPPIVYIVDVYFTSTYKHYNTLLLFFLEFLFFFNHSFLLTGLIFPFFPKHKGHIFFLIPVLTKKI